MKLIRIRVNGPEEQSSILSVQASSVAIELFSNTQRKFGTDGLNN